ncbi:MAG TPA: hypothetical protein VHD89_10510 [Rhodanobacteraceae bacterium]|nr:hypothetical protein [Rhodanobacteraceae bacterium]
MEPQRAYEIVRMLADSCDPFGGEILPGRSTLQHPDGVRALCAAAATLRTPSDTTAPARKLPANAGKPWNSAEDAQLAGAYDLGTHERELMQKHQRTAGSIRARLIKPGRVKPPASSTRAR